MEGRSRECRGWLPAGGQAGVGYPCPPRATRVKDCPGPRVERSSAGAQLDLSHWGETLGLLRQAGPQNQQKGLPPTPWGS